MESVFDFFRNLMGMAPLASSNGQRVDELIIYIHWLMIALFVGWSCYFVFTLWRFRASRHPKADHKGVRGHASSYLELVVAGIEVLILVGVAIPLWARAVDVTGVADSGDATTIQVVAEQFAWNGRYQGADGEFGRQDMRLVNETNKFGVDFSDEAAADDIQLINQFHVPVNKPVVAFISSKDVIHSFKINSFRVCQDAIPGMRIPTWFEPTQTGRYQIVCAQLCGNGHSSMAGGFLVVETQEDYDAWLAANSGTSAADMSFE